MELRIDQAHLRFNVHRSPGAEARNARSDETQIKSREIAALPTIPLVR
jgi:hypothetical protein